jgi:hypothetical protein
LAKFYEFQRISLLLCNWVITLAIFVDIYINTK